MVQTAVVSGAGSGIGRAVARRLANGGYRVVLIGRREPALAATLEQMDGSGHTVLPGDLTIARDVAKIAAAIEEGIGAVDAIVHCAGGLVARTGDDVASLRTQLMDSFDSNVVSTAMLTEALDPLMRDGRCRVVATSSIAAFRGGGLAYASCKAALHGWAFTSAQQLGPRGITVNIVAPGYIAETEFFGTAMTPTRHDMLVDQTMNKRAGVPEDVAAMVEYLVSPDAGHVTAQVMQVNGGALAR